MAIKPNIKNEKVPEGTKKCNWCGRVMGYDKFAFTHSLFYKDNHLPICNDCITEYLRENDFDWECIDKVCQWADIPWIVKEWERLSELNDESNIWAAYARVFNDDDYKSLGWGDYFKQYKKLKEVGLIEEELPQIREQKYARLRKKWGSHYDEESLNYLESLYRGILVSQNVNGDLQQDQAQKLCKISLELESRIRAGDKDMDKILSSYERLTKIADFSAKNTKNAADFDSVAELALWVEKRGYQNKFYDGATRDVIDETIKNIQSYNQRLYINEGGMGEAIENRIKSLQSVENKERLYNLSDEEFDADKYDNDGFAFEDDEEEFDPGGED